ncbi:MAG: class I SAM-dependent methyltransferase [Acetobacteraceae bacterium]
MTTRTVKVSGLRASLFADSRRVGVEFSLRRIPKADRNETPEQGDLPPAGTAQESGDLRSLVNGITWYHTIDLGDGIVTPGFYDHRPILERYRLAPRLDGLRVLDIATFDGFWAYEFERRGAAEVIALDIARAAELDLAPSVRAAMTQEDLERRFGAGFTLAHERLGSKVRHVHCNVYDLSPDRFGLFDIVHCGDLLLHLRDPALALTRIREVTRGHALISDCIFPDLDRHDDMPMMQYDGGLSENIWWRFGAVALSRMIRDAGFREVEEIARFKYGPRGAPASMWHAVYRATV